MVAAGQRVVAARAELYLALAEALAEPPAWLARAGHEWPLFVQAETLAPVSAAAARALPLLAQVEQETAAARRARYRALFAGPGRPRFWLHESLHRSGRLPGPATFTVGRLYAAAGLSIGGGELPDHASLELAFLGHLARQERAAPARAGSWRRLARQFIRRHAGGWLPDLGRALAASGDPVYGPIGALLAGWLQEAGGKTARQPAGERGRLPRVEAADCTLCGFCVQSCPARALAIVEDAHETTLMLATGRCSGCGRCVGVCEPGALTLVAATQVPGEQLRPLRRSARVACRGCGRPTVSRAELDFVAARLGRPRWLDYCMPCRAQGMEDRNGFPDAIPAL